MSARKRPKIVVARDESSDSSSDTSPYTSEGESSGYEVEEGRAGLAPDEVVDAPAPPDDRREVISVREGFSQLQVYPEKDGVLLPPVGLNQRNGFDATATRKAFVAHLKDNKTVFKYLIESAGKKQYTCLMAVPPGGENVHIALAGDDQPMTQETMENAAIRLRVDKEKHKAVLDEFYYHIDAKARNAMKDTTSDWYGYGPRGMLLVKIAVAVVPGVTGIGVYDDFETRVGQGDHTIDSSEYGKIMECIKQLDEMQALGDVDRFVQQYADITELGGTVDKTIANGYYGRYNFHKKDRDAFSRFTLAVKPKDLTGTASAMRTSGSAQSRWALRSIEKTDGR